MANKALIAARTQALVELTAGFCDAHLDAEYRELSEKLIRKLSRKRNVPFVTGRLEIWAGAVIYALGQINFLFDRSFEPYVSRDTLCDYFGISKSTSGQKAQQIRELLKLRYYDPEFSTRHMQESNPFAKLVMAVGDGDVIHLVSVSPMDALFGNPWADRPAKRRQQ